MRAEMVRANTMEVQPVLVTRMEVTATPARGLVVANVGRGTALHVSIDDIEIEVAPPGKDAERFTGEVRDD